MTKPNTGMIVELVLLALLMALMITENQTISWLTWAFRGNAAWWHAVMPWVYAVAFFVLWGHLFLGWWAPKWAGWRQNNNK